MRCLFVEVVTNAFMNESRQTNWARLCLVTAVDVEFNIAMKLLTNVVLTQDSGLKLGRGQVSGQLVTVLQTEMGAPGFAEKLRRHLAHNAYDVLLIAGLAGGLAPHLSSGTGVLYDRCYDARTGDSVTASKEKRPSRDENASIRCDSAVVDDLSRRLTQAGLTGLRGAGLTCAQIVTRSAEKQRLGKQYDALAADMESFMVLAVCAERNLPAAVLRVISDDANCDLPDFNRAATAEGRLQPASLAWAMLSQPGASWQFLRQLRPALKSLQRHLQAVLGASVGVANLTTKAKLDS